MSTSTETEAIVDLLDWRRHVFELYRQVRELHPDDPAGAHHHWRVRRDELASGHPQSPFPDSPRPQWAGLDYFAYDPGMAFTADVEPASEERFELPTSTGSTTAFVRFGRVRLPLGTLDLYWLDAYGGGLFLPFRDATAGTETYGGGRYLLDTVKGADLGSSNGGALVLDFNFAYNPSCHYDPRWTCPLPPSDNWLDSRIEAGERSFPSTKTTPRLPSPNSSAM